MHGAGEQLGIGAGGVVERHGRGLQILVALGLASGGAGVIAHDAEHVLAVRAQSPGRPRARRAMSALVA